jgi:hypothetical protein
MRKELAKELEKVVKKSAPVGVAVLVAGSLPGRPPATMLSLTPVLKRDGKCKPWKGNPVKGCGKQTKWELPVGGSRHSSPGLREASY